jgi:hypothetical protein
MAYSVELFKHNEFVNHTFFRGLRYTMRNLLELTRNRLGLIGLTMLTLFSYCLLTLCRSASCSELIPKLGYRVIGDW